MCIDRATKQPCQFPLSHIDLRHALCYNNPHKGSRGSYRHRRRGVSPAVEKMAKNIQYKAQQAMPPEPSLPAVPLTIRLLACPDDAVLPVRLQADALVDDLGHVPPPPVGRDEGAPDVLPEHAADDRPELLPGRHLELLPVVLPVPRALHPLTTGAWAPGDDGLEPGGGDDAAPGAEPRLLEPDGEVPARVGAAELLLQVEDEVLIEPLPEQGARRARAGQGVEDDHVQGAAPGEGPVDPAKEAGHLGRGDGRGDGQAVDRRVRLLCETNAGGRDERAMHRVDVGVLLA